MKKNELLCFAKEYLLRSRIHKKLRGIMLPMYALEFIRDRKRYKISPEEYFEFSFYEKEEKEKETFFPASESEKMAFEIDSTWLGRWFTNKTALYRLFSKQMRREQLFTEWMTEDDFMKFTEKHESFLFKPYHNWDGRGIQMYNISQANSVHELYMKLARELGVLDEIIIQHVEMQKLNRTTVNTIRVVTVRVANETHILGAAVRIGRDGGTIDNYASGGIVCSVDMETGVIKGPGEDKYANRYTEHPDSKTLLPGFRVPNWEKVIELAYEVAEISPIHFVGWDIAVREDDCVLVEGNYNPSVCIIQVAGAGGKRSEYEKELHRYRVHKQTLKE